MGKLKTKIRTVKKWYYRIYKHKDKVDIGRTIKLPWKTKLKYNLLGFTKQDYVAFNLAKNDYHQYISYWERSWLEDINGRFSYIIGEKVLFERLFGGDVHVPHIFLWVHNNSFVSPDTGEIVDALKVIKEQGRVIAKPTRSIGGGNGIHSVSFSNGTFFYDDVSVEENPLKATLLSLKDYIIVQFIHQAEYSEAVFPNTANSIRVATGRWKDGHVSFLYAFHRFGTSTTGAVDNISSGGVFAFIDDGVLSKGKHYTDLSEELECHPDTGAQIEGIVVPGWKELIEKLVEAHIRNPFYNFLAWDVVIDQNNVPYILEINRGSDLGIQAIKPLRNEAMGQFMREYDCLSPRIDR